MKDLSKGKLPQRGEIPKEFRWKLGDIYKSASHWEDDYRWVKENLPSLKEHEGNLGESAQNLLSGLDTYTGLMKRVEKLYVYAHMKKDQDNANTQSQGLLDRAQGLMVEFGGFTSFLVPEILEIPESRIKEYIEALDGLMPYGHYLGDIMRRKEHVLSPKEEKILAMAGEVAAAPEHIFGMVNNADMRFPYITDENGHEVELTHGRYLQFMESRDREVRKQAFDELYKTYGKQKNTIAATLNYSIKKDIFYSKIRNYPSTLENALHSDKVPVLVYDNLIKAVEDNMDAMHRYVSLRKRALGLDELHMYDLYVPIVRDVEMKIPYNKAKDMIGEALNPLGDNYLDILEEGFNSGWIDVLENEGKTSGAYSWGCYDTHPYVLMNYQENIDNVFTLAHEMGHAIHSYLSNKNQPYILAGYKIFVAEVASTLNEILLTNHLLENLEDDRQKAYVLNYYLEQFRGTVYRQTMFAEFERIVHGMAEGGEPLTVESLSEAYYKLNLKYYGPDMVVDDEIALEWARIPHFYSSFYVYKYATGFSAAAALAQRILDEGQPAVDRYLNFLSRGGSDYPIELLKGAGVDMTSPKPVNQALKTFSALVDRMGKLL
ncbi:MAG TPA: oligoendopeptidase F [Clostridia bacterium]|nr:oligoendopeptidase F [Clostridia bacterium]